MNQLQHNQSLQCVCGKPLPLHTGKGRKKRFCSAACKQLQYRNRLIENRNAKQQRVYFPDALGQVHSSENISPSQLLLQSGGICQSDALTILKTLPDEIIDCLVTDPPYGYSFMGKDWDKAVPSVEIWKECVRVLKPGSFAFIMSAPRQDVLSQMIVRLSEAGFRTDFTSLYWARASGFPKAANIGKMVDKRKGTYERGELLPTSRKSRPSPSGAYGQGVQTKYAHTPKHHQAKALDGSYGGFQPKPAVEVILVCMKPLSENTFVDQALNNGKGVTWLDDCRIPYESEDIPTERKVHVSTIAQMSVVRTDYKPNSQGRFPANLLVSDEALNDGRITQSSRSDYNLEPSHAEGTVNFLGDKKFKSSIHYGDSGSFSRYFDLDAWFEKKLEELPASVRQTFPYLIVPKASKSEKNKGLDNISNVHPTVKPLKLMSYLITLGSRHGDVILDPFMGSGTTCVAASQLGRRYIGIELHAEYVNIAQQRLDQAS